MTEPNNYIVKSFDVVDQGLLFTRCAKVTCEVDLNTVRGAMVFRLDKSTETVAFEAVKAMQCSVVRTKFHFRFFPKSD